MKNFLKNNWFKIGIIIAIVICGGFIYQSQINKQRSIEKQQEIKLQDDKRQQEVENALNILKLKQAECDALSSGVMKKWNNVMGVTYDNNTWNECVVTYTDTETGKIGISPLRLMQTNK